MKTIKIFLASSEELKDERLQLADLVENLNHTLAKQDLHIQLVKWEYLDSSMGPMHKQEEYNEELRTCELCLVLYWTRFGMYTKTELDTAYNQLCAGNNPKKLYVYFKDGSEISPDLQSFRDSFPDQYGHFFCHFENIDTLKADFLLQFMDYQSKALKDSKNIEVKDGKVVIDGKEYVDLQNVPFAGNNEEYNNLRKLIKKNKKLLAITEPDDPDYTEYASELQEQQEKLAKMECSLWDTALMITRLSTTKCSERLQRAMDLFNQGNNKGAQAILNEEEIEKDVQHNLNLIKLGEEGKKGLKTNIDEYLLKIRTYENEMEEGWLQKRCELCDRVLQLTISLYGENAEETADVYSRSGNAYEELGNYNLALELHQKALAIREIVVGKEHVDTAKSYRNIAGVYSNLCDYSQALEYYHKALAIQEKTLGKEHLDTAKTYNGIGMLYNDLSDFTQALEYLQKALTIRENILGKDHPETASSYANIGCLYGDMGNYEKDLEYQMKALEIEERHHEKESPEMTASYNNIGYIYQALRDYDMALEYYQKALAVMERIFGTQHPVTAMTYNNIGRLYIILSDDDKAIEYLKKALDIRKNTLGKEHLDTSSSFETLGSLYFILGNYEKALDYGLEALEIDEKILGKEHPNTTMLYRNIGLVYSNMGKVDQAIEYYQKELPGAEKAVESSPNNPIVIDILATVYQNLGRYDEALEQFERCIELYEQEEAEDDIRETEEKIASLKDLMKKEG